MLIWHDIHGYKGSYQVSNTGLIKSFMRNNSEGSILNPGFKKGYQTVNLCRENIRKSVSVHRLVATTFLPQPDGCNIVNHKDGNKLNNHIDNLEWVASKC